MRMPSDDRTYESFWRQAARGLAGEAPDPVSVASSFTPALGGPAAIDISVRNASYEPVPDADVRVSVRDPDGIAREVPSTAAGETAGEHTAAFVPEERGLYRVT